MDIKEALDELKSKFNRLKAGGNPKDVKLIETLLFYLEEINKCIDLWNEEITKNEEKGEFEEAKKRREYILEITSELERIAENITKKTKAH